LKSWCADGGVGNVQSLTVDTRGGLSGGAQGGDSRMDVADVKEAAELLSDTDPKGQYFTVRSYISRVNPREESAMWYASCPKCNKKVIGDEASGHSCENCGWSGAECTYRYIVPVILLDGEGSILTTAFNDQAAALFGKKADELKQLKDTNPPEFDAVVQQAMWKPTLFRLRAKMESYNNQARLKAAILSAAPINFCNEGKLLLSDIAKYELPAADLTLAATTAPPTAKMSGGSPAAKAEPVSPMAVKPEPMEEVEAPSSQAAMDASHFSQFDD